MNIKSSNTLYNELNKFSLEQRALISDNIFAIKLTSGCSSCCSFCGLGIKEKVKDKISFNLIEKIANEINSLTKRSSKFNENLHLDRGKNQIMLYYGTDPADYIEDDKDFFSVYEIFSKLGFETPVITSIPKGREKWAIKNLDKITSISISHMNRERLMPYFKELNIGVYIDLFNYNQALRLKNKERIFLTSFENPNEMIEVENFNNKGFYAVKEKLKKLIREGNKFPENLNPKFYNLNKDQSIWRYKVQDLEKSIFLVCGNKDGFRRHYKINDLDYFGINKVGNAYNLENELDRSDRFGEVNGVLISPLGFFNRVSVPITNENKKGYILEKITPENFGVVELNYNPDINYFSYRNLDYKLKLD